MTLGMTNVPAARFEETATEQGSQGLLDSVGTFVEGCGIEATDRERIAATLTVILAVAAGHASSRDDMRIAVIADVMPGDVQLVLRLCPRQPVRRSRTARTRSADSSCGSASRETDCRHRGMNGSVAHRSARPV